MKDYGRKFWLGVAFLAVSTGMTVYMTLRMPSPDFIGLATVIGAQAGGVLAIVWGNAKEHQAKAGSPKAEG